MTKEDYLARFGDGPTAFDIKAIAGDAWDNAVAELSTQREAAIKFLEAYDALCDDDHVGCSGPHHKARDQLAAQLAAQEPAWTPEQVAQVHREADAMRAKFRPGRVADAPAADGAQGERQPDELRQHIYQRLAELPDSWLTAREELETVLRLLNRR